jgi:mercuric reductase
MKLELKISGMTCQNCAQHVVKALEDVEGVEAANVDYRVGRGTLELSHPVPTEALVGAVQRAGYGAEVVGAGGAATAVPGTGTSDTPSFAREIPHRASARPQDVGSAGTREFDLVIVGTGGAGVAAAIQAAELGARVGIAEQGTLGGTCVNVGCIPSKNLIEAAAHYHDARYAFPGVAPCEPSLDWTAVLAQKDALVAQLRRSKYADVLASYPAITLLQGHARLPGNGRVQVGDAEYRTRKVIIASGTSPAMPAIPGLDLVDAVDSTTVMELTALPASMIVLGGSAVGLELGQTFARFGVKVTVLELLPRLLPNEDEAISDALRGFLEAEGIEVHTGITTTRVERDGSAIVVHVQEGSLTGQFRAERILVATGRRPNTIDMGLEETGVVLTPKGFVNVDTTLRTSNPDVYAAGDVTGGPGYVYVAAAEGRVAAANALSEEQREFDLSVVPNVTFTSPQVGSVGLTEAKAREAGYTVQVSTLPMENVPRALVSRDTRGLVKIVADVATDRLLGIHAVAPNAGEFMGEATLAIRFGLTARDLTGTLHPYLTWIESLKLSAQGFTSDVSKLSCCA